MIDLIKLALLIILATAKLITYIVVTVAIVAFVIWLMISFPLPVIAALLLWIAVK